MTEKRSYSRRGRPSLIFFDFGLFSNTLYRYLAVLTARINMSLTSGDCDERRTQSRTEVGDGCRLVRCSRGDFKAISIVASR